MLRRWIVRSLFLVPLVCVVGVWGASYFGTISCFVFCRGHALNSGVFEGLSAFEIWTDPDYAGPSVDCQFVDLATAKRSFVDPTVLGFWAGKPEPVPGSYGIVFPLWLPTLLLLGLNGFVWRKTRRRAGGGAFPVEPNAVAK